MMMMISSWLTYVQISVSSGPQPDFCSLNFMAYQ
jgi:hypothetical protein